MKGHIRSLKIRVSMEALIINMAYSCASLDNFNSCEFVSSERIELAFAWLEFNLWPICFWGVTCCFPNFSRRVINYDRNAVRSVVDYVKEEMPIIFFQKLRKSRSVIFVKQFSVSFGYCHFGF